MATLRQRQDDAVRELADRCPRLDATRVVDRLVTGTLQLRDLLRRRIHQDVEQELGFDSMLGPLNLAQEARQLHRINIEAEAFAAVLVDEEAVRNGYIESADGWFLEWIARGLLGEDARATLLKRADLYHDHAAKDYRTRFASVLHHAVPESKKAPTVLFRLFPRAVRIVACLAFDDHARAEQLRQEQYEVLPAIRDCRTCHARVLDRGEHCDSCGNPLWTYNWLRADC